MQRNKLFNVLVLGALTLGGCGTVADPGDVTPDAALSDTSPDASDPAPDGGTLVADASDGAIDAGDSNEADAGGGGGVCMWGGMDPCPC